MTRKSKKDLRMDTQHTQSQTQTRTNTLTRVCAARINETAEPREAFHVWRDQTYCYVLKIIFSQNPRSFSSKNLAQIFIELAGLPKEDLDYVHNKA